MSTLMVVDQSPAVADRAELRRQLRQARRDRAAAGDDSAAWVAASVQMRVLEDRLAAPVLTPDDLWPAAPPVAVEPAIVEPFPVSAPLQATVPLPRAVAAPGGRWAALGLLVVLVAVSAVLAPLTLAVAVLVLALAWRPGRRVLLGGAVLPVTGTRRR